jgi:hypothetical protein
MPAGPLGRRKCLCNLTEPLRYRGVRSDAPHDRARHWAQHSPLALEMRQLDEDERFR